MGRTIFCPAQFFPSRYEIFPSPKKFFPSRKNRMKKGKIGAVQRYFSMPFSALRKRFRKMIMRFRQIAVFLHKNRENIHIINCQKRKVESQFSRIWKGKRQHPRLSRSSSQTKSSSSGATCKACTEEVRRSSPTASSEPSWGRA